MTGIVLDFKANLTGTKITAKDLKDAGQTALRKGARPPIKREMKNKVKRWDTRGQFVGRVTSFQDGYQLDVQPQGNPFRNYWMWTSQGTSPRIILPRNSNGVLVFPSGYTPHTTASGGSGGSGKRHGVIVRTPLVRHPGTEARTFEEDIIEDIEDDIEDAVSNLFFKRLGI